MKCPECGAATKVVDSRELKLTNTIRRRRECLNEACGLRRTTKELFDNDVQQVREATQLKQSLRTLLGGFPA